MKNDKSKPMTDLTPSQEILRLCKELNIEPPHIRWIGQWPKDTPYLTATALLRWKGWGDIYTVATETGKKNTTAKLVLFPTLQPTLRAKDESPDTALQHLAIARLRQIKQEKEK